MESNARARRRSRQVYIGGVAVGGDAPISVQTMTKTDTRNVEATVAQIREVESLGCDIVRLAVVDECAATAIREIRRSVHIPIVADIHYNHKLAIMALEAGADALRINPGNIGGTEHVKEVASAAQARNAPIRIGVNSGSLEKDIEAKHGARSPEALVESAMRHVRMLEGMGFDKIKISVKASDALRTVRAYRLLAEETDYPLHLGVTEAGTFLAGTVRSAAAMGILLAEGIGDTIRVSLTDTPAQEVRVASELLRSLGLREPGPCVISCPTCGRVEVDVPTLAKEIETRLEKHYRDHPGAPRPVVAVMGCMVNGPGEAQDADIAISGGRGKFALYVNGKHERTVDETHAVETVVETAKSWRRRPSMS